MEIDVSSEELFNSALSDEPPEVVEQTAESDQGVARDEQGRFAPKAEEPAKPEPEAQAKPAEPKEEAQVPSWRLRELRERAEAAETRARQIEQQLLALRPKPEPVAKPDIFEKPDEFVRSNVQEIVSPLEQRLSTAIETMSRNFAISQHGEERVTQAYSALDQAAKRGDPQALAVVSAVKQSNDPYGDIARWYAGNEASLNPEAFFQRKLEEAMKDEKFKEGLMQKLSPTPEASPEPVFRLPPSVGRIPSAKAASESGGDMGDRSLFEHAMR